jgi:hypothetical protein
LPPLLLLTLLLRLRLPLPLPLLLPPLPLPQLPLLLPPCSCSCSHCYCRHRRRSHSRCCCCSHCCSCCRSHSHFWCRCRHCFHSRCCCCSHPAAGVATGVGCTHTLCVCACPHSFLLSSPHCPRCQALMGLVCIYIKYRVSIWTVVILLTFKSNDYIPEYEGLTVFNIYNYNLPFVWM